MQETEPNCYLAKEVSTPHCVIRLRKWLSVVSAFNSKVNHGGRNFQMVDVNKSERETEEYVGLSSRMYDTPSRRCVKIEHRLPIPRRTLSVLKESFYFCKQHVRHGKMSSATSDR